MFTVIDCITTDHNLWLVGMAAAICLIACFTAIDLFFRASAAEGTARFRWLAGTGFVAGAGIWATHFIAMLAFDSGMPVGYDIPLTLLSILIAVSMCTLGAAVALYMGQLTIGGIIVGAAIGTMHFTGMSALLVPGHIDWDASYVTAAWIIGVAAMALAFNIIPRMAGMKRHLIGTLVFVIAICGLHFTAMAAVTIVPDPTVTVPDALMDPQWLAIFTAVLSLMILGVGFMLSVFDRHLASRTADEAQRLRIYTEELEATRDELETARDNLMSALEAAAAGSQAKSQFLATISHELRTPLNAVIGFSEVIMQEQFGPLENENYKEYVQMINESGGHLLSLINDILDFSKVDAGRLELEEAPFSLADAVSAASSMVSHIAEAAKVDVRTNFSAPLPSLVGDERRVRQVLLNILSNAVKFTPDGGHVEVTCETRGEEALALIITDTGIGMAPEDVPRALENFGQIDNSLSRRFEGTGLGLPLSNRLMQLHGGALEIESELGAGTKVSLVFPADRLVTANSGYALDWSHIGEDERRNEERYPVKEHSA